MASAVTARGNGSQLWMPTPPKTPQSSARLDTPASFVPEVTGQLLEAERVRSERLLNRVRAVVLILLAVSAAFYSSHLTPALNRVNMWVLIPMLLWTAAQQIVFHGERGAPRWLSLANAIIDTTAISTVLAGYGSYGFAELAVKSPMFLAYIVIVAAQPLTSSARRAALVSALAVSEYAALIVFLVATGRLDVTGSPLTSPVMPGTSLLDEGARLLLLAVAGGAATYATARHERTLRNALIAQARRDAEERALSIRLQEADKLAAVGTLAATVAHEVNNPLATIGLLAELLRETPLDPKQRDSIDGIIAECRRTAAVVRDLMRVARPEEEEDEAVSLSVIAERSLSLLRPLLRDQRVFPELVVADDLPTIRGFSGRLEQVVINLVINAMHAMEGRGTTKVVRLATGRDEDHVWLTVEDTGTGFPEGIAERVFERFFTTKPVGKGTGLGLWIAREIVGAHGGRIIASNREEGGARFELRFPLVRARAAA
jgi:signal transduction histidine kinase